MNIDMKDILALLGEKTLQIAILDGQVQQLQQQLQAQEDQQKAAKAAIVPHKVVESVGDASRR